MKRPAGSRPNIGRGKCTPPPLRCRASSRILSYGCESMTWLGLFSPSRGEGVTPSAPPSQWTRQQRNACPNPSPQRIVLQKESALDVVDRSWIDTLCVDEEVLFDAPPLHQSRQPIVSFAAPRLQINPLPL